jgi:hypothetical protein
MPVSTPASGRSHLLRWARWGAGVVALGLASLALAYLLTPYATLRDWYLARTPNLYRADIWARDFFTPATKAQGNWFCAGGLALLALALGWQLVPLVSRARLGFGAAQEASAAPPSAPLAWAPTDWRYLAGLLLAGAGCWAWGAGHLPPAYDEVFSVVYSAGNGSPFVAWSYYMLPNNHLLFNILNGVLFGWLPNITGLLLTGRLLSGLAYLATIGVIYRTLARFTGQRPLAAGLALLAAVQYSLWGFGSQARGYALYALLHWLAIATVLGYWQRPTRGGRWGNALAVALGYATVPTFLFYHVAQLLAVALVQVRRRFDGRFWLAQAVALGAVYWFYLPALCFSGLKALTGNQYVRPHHGPLREFILKVWPHFRDYATYCFGNTGLGDGVGYALALLPLVLLVWPVPAAVAGSSWPWRRLAALYALWLLVLAAGILKLQLLVFPRNLLGLFSLMLVLGLLTLGVLAGRWRRWAGLAAPLLLATWIGARFVRNNPVKEPFDLYTSAIVPDYQAGQQRITTLPRAGTLAFSQESFYPYFLSQQVGRLAPHPAHRPVVATDYFVTAPNDRLPPRLAPRYQPVDTVGRYRLYRRAPGMAEQ